MAKQRVLVAMSGGVDSSIAAVILKHQGYDVIGATMKIWPKELCLRHKEKTCCSLRDIEDAKRVCRKLGVRHYVLNFEKVFRKEVIDYFVGEYLGGRTPNPCIVCNEKVKFGALLQKAKELECGFISTGHYARIEKNGVCRLRESVDKIKDQSYVLFSLSAGIMKAILLPIGEFTKVDIKLKAKRLGLSLHEKPESQEICFVPGNSYSEFIKEYCGIPDKKGRIVNADGKTLGEHNGFWSYTIGQRKGLGIAHKSPLYVIDIDAQENKVTVGEASEVKKRRFIVKGLNWLCETKEDSFEAMAKIRYNHKKKKALIKKIKGNKAEVEFFEGQEAITPGQAAVFYKGEFVLGGGWIEKIL